VNNIPPFDLTRQYELIGAEIGAAVLGVLASGRYIGGSPVQNFEQQFASYIGVSECVSCNSGTDALYMALRALNIGAGDEVITTPFTFIATAEVISHIGATPVFVDIDRDTFNLDLAQLESAITPQTRAIIPVHLFGQPVDMTRLMTIARAHNLIVIEDCAQATGAEWAEQKVGSIGQIGCFSFFPTKNLGACGDGGALTTNDPTIAAQVRTLREHGMRARYIHEETGINSRLDAIQATILQIKLRHLDTWNAQRRAIADRYRQLLTSLPGVISPKELSGSYSVWNQYTTRIPSSTNSGTSASFSAPSLEILGNNHHNYRDWVRSQLQARGVSSMVYYPLPLHLQPVYQGLGYRRGQFPIAEQVCQEVLSLPMFPELLPEQQEQIVHHLKDCLVQEVVASREG